MKKKLAIICTAIVVIILAVWGMAVIRCNPYKFDLPLNSITKKLSFNEAVCVYFPPNSNIPVERIVTTDGEKIAAVVPWYSRFESVGSPSNILTQDDCKYIKETIMFVLKNYQKEIYGNVPTGHQLEAISFILFSNGEILIAGKCTDDCIIHILIDKDGKYESIKISGVHKRNNNPRIIAKFNE